MTACPAERVGASRANLFAAELLGAALDYASRGYPVFPVRGHDKVPLVKWGEAATTDAATIRGWWTRWPLAMIGMPTGARSGIDVLDVDRKNGVDGLENLRALGIDPFRLSPIVAETPSGGLHFYFTHGGPLKNSVGLLAEGVDMRGDGGMATLPPSVRDVNDPGSQYSWEWGDAAL